MRKREDGLELGAASDINAFHTKEVITSLRTGRPLFPNQGNETSETQSFSEGTVVRPKSGPSGLHGEGSREESNELHNLVLQSQTRTVTRHTSEDDLHALGTVVLICLVPLVLLIGAALLTLLHNPPTGGISPPMPPTRRTLRPWPSPDPPEPTAFVQVSPYPIWCVYSRDATQERAYSPSDMPHYYCSAFIYAYANLATRGKIEDLGPLSDVIDKLKENAARYSVSKPREVYLAVGGLNLDLSVARATTSVSRYRTQFCMNLSDSLDSKQLSGVVLHFPSDALVDETVSTDFAMDMGTCMEAASMKMVLVAPSNDIERSTYFPYLTWSNLSFTVLVWTHNPHRIPGVGTTAHCPVNIPNMVRFQKELKAVHPDLHKRTVVSLSLRALRFKLLRPKAPDRLDSAIPAETAVVPYTDVCRVVGLQGEWTSVMSKDDGCVHVSKDDMWMSSMHAASDSFIVFSVGVVLFDMHYDDFVGVCGEKHALAKTVVRGMNYSKLVHP